MTSLVLFLALAQPQPVTLTVTPAPLSADLYRCRLLPNLDELRPGDAAALLLRKAPVIDEPRASFPEQLSAADLGTARAILRQHRELLERTEQAALCARADWTHLIRVVLRTGAGRPELNLAGANLLLLRARVEVAEGRPGDAVRTLGRMLALARHMNDCPFVEAHDSAVSVALWALDGIELAVQHRRCPNLYTALCDLPRPLLPARTAHEVERLFACAAVPGSAEVRRDPFVPLDRETFQRFLERYRAEHPPTMRSLNPLADHYRLAADLQADLPRGRQVLLEHGYSKDEINHLPILNIALLAPLLEFEERATRASALAAFPSSAERSRFLATHPEPPRNGAGLLFSRSGRWPDPSEFRAPVDHCQRRLDMLRIVEALRMHAHATGTWPERLADVTAVPIPDDPITGQPFRYKRDGTHAVLEAPDDATRPHLLTLREPEGKP
jgi:hypothetical protein